MHYFMVFPERNVGNKIYDEIRPTMNTFYFNSNKSTDVLKAWSTSNPDSDIPSLTTINSNDELRTSSFYISDGSYVRLKSAQIGYNLSRSLAQRWKIANARIFIQAQNLFEITSFKGFDFEPFGFEGRLTQTLYPHSRSVSVGVNVGF